VPQIVRAVEHLSLDLRIPEQQAPDHIGHDLDMLAQRTATVAKFTLRHRVASKYLSSRESDLASIPGGGK
jgi:hypothetical protein